MDYSERTEDRALADRLVNYVDAIVAVAFLASSGIGLALADPDTRESLESVAFGIIIGNALLGVVFSFIVAVLRRWELDLRQGVTHSAKYIRYSRRMYLAKHAVIWISIVQTVVILAAAS
ncbi:MAG: hypothetical protein AB8C02_04390 [Halioglobus sp.]